MKSEKTCIIHWLFVLQLIGSQLLAQSNPNWMKEPHRPQVHFSPEANWVNDPNGMVYHNGIYHLFFQYHPNSTIWGPMHWGHATSKDLIHWVHEPIAIYPDSLGTIFSGSAVLDKNNTSGFAINGRAPLVAIFTHHDAAGEKAGSNDFQTQSIAFSNDDGKTWTKYASNPVLKNPGIRDFRDPKVCWFEPQKKWIMTLATKDIITFYSSPDLKNWIKESEFGAGRGAHGGVWECPDLIELEDKGIKRWVLIVNLNPGGPNIGSGTQYFVGNFDGHSFTSEQTETRWLDYGPDNYAGITWSNTGKRKVLIGWMSNWMYANQVPTEKWRNAMTIPRELKLRLIGNEFFVLSQPVNELKKIQAKPMILKNIMVGKKIDLNKETGNLGLPSRLDLEMEEANDFTIILSNELGEELIIGYDPKQNQYFIDRSKSGKIGFQTGFGARHTAPRFEKNSKMKLTMVVDVSSVELFADDGLTVMTEIFFPTTPYNQISIQSTKGVIIKKLKYFQLKGIWE